MSARVIVNQDALRNALWFVWAWGVVCGLIVAGTVWWLA